jgi:hypothetical protein
MVRPIGEVGGVAGERAIDSGGLRHLGVCKARLSAAAFEAWTQSEAFRAAHNRAGDNKPFYLGHPQFEGFEVRLTAGIGKTRVA